MKTVEVFEEIFGKGFWKFVSIVVTHWSNNPEEVKNRTKSQA